MATLDILVAASSDDVNTRSSTASYQEGDWTAQGIGKWSYNDDCSSMRFLNVTIPQGATITAAYIAFTCYMSVGTGLVSCTLRGEAADNCPTYTNWNNWVARSLTSASVAWTGIGVWTGDVVYNSPSLTTIIQEIVNRPGWVSGNALAIRIDNNTTTSDVRCPSSYDGSTTKCPLLHIVYAAAPQLTATKLTLTLTSIDALLLRDAKLDLETQTLTLTSIDAFLLKGFALQSETLTLTISDQDIALLKGSVLQSETLTLTIAPVNTVLSIRRTEIGQSMRTTKRLLYSTPLDVRLCSRLVEKKDYKDTDAALENFADPDDAECITDAEIEHYILMTDGMIRAKLANYYTESDFVLLTPIAGTPISSRKNTVRNRQAYLTGAYATSSAITEQWTLIFDGVGKTFKVWGSFSGNQGSGKTDANYYSTLENVCIAADAWFFDSGTTEFGQGDKIYFSTYNIDPRIVFISSHLTCANVLRALLSDQTPNYSAFIDKIEGAALKLLDDLATGKTQLSLIYNDIAPDGYAYYIDSVGLNESERQVIPGSEPYSDRGYNFDRGL